MKISESFNLKMANVFLWFLINESNVYGCMGQKEETKCKEFKSCLDKKKQYLPYADLKSIVMTRTYNS